MAVNFNNFSDGGQTMSDNSYIVGFSNTNSGGEKKWSWLNFKNIIKRYIDTQFAFPKMLVNFNGTQWDAVGDENRVTVRGGFTNVNRVVRISKGVYRIYFSSEIPLFYIPFANCEINGDKDETAVPWGLNKDYINITTYSLNRKTDMPFVYAGIFK